MGRDMKTKQQDHFRGYAAVNPLSVPTYQFKVIRAYPLNFGAQTDYEQNHNQLYSHP